VAATWKTPHGDGLRGQIANAVDMVVLYDLMALAANDRASDQVRAIARFKLYELDRWLDAQMASRQPILEPAHVAFASRQIAQFQKDPKKMDLTPPAEPPDGPPIGTDDDWDGWD
jgi:hypothetical protein